MSDQVPWWQKGIVYQIYPLSFMDRSGDGVGDLSGIVARLDYVESLGIDAIWLSPIFPSPMTDFGYDVSDYTAVDPLFGSMADFDELLAEVHRRRMRLILDLVPNHTSNLHPWFLESRSSRENPKRNWYVWHDPAPAGGPPNNWVSYYGSAWTFDPRTGQYYLHQFRESQPELNYREPDVLEAIRAVMRFWLDKGVDGFRVDVIALLSKDELFRDEPANREFRPEQYVYHSLQHIYTQDLPVVHDYVRAMRSTLDEYEGRVLLGELDPIPNLMSYYGLHLDECHLPFNFHLLYEPWEAQVLRRTIEGYEAALPAGAWPNWVLGNHDKPRVASRVGCAQARVAQMLLLTLRGTPICYYGDEIGMTDVPIPPHRLRDWNAPNLADALRLSRDPQRTPMQWDGGPNAGFTPPGVEPWLPVPSAHDRVNVAAEDGSGDSMLNLFRRLSALRRELPALSAGTYRSLEMKPASAIVAYERCHGGVRTLVALNLSDEQQLVDLAAAGPRGEILLSTEVDRRGTEKLVELRLRPNEGLIARVE